MTNTKNDPRTRHGARAKVNGTADHAQRTATLRPWSSALPRLDEAQVRQAVADAPIRELARALDPGAFQGDHGNDGFVCPRCSMWSAEITSECLWYCSTCPHTGTRLGLMQLVLADAIACVALATRTADG